MLPSCSSGSLFLLPGIGEDLFKRLIAESACEAVVDPGLKFRDGELSAGGF